MILEELKNHSEKSYAVFQSALTPGVPRSSFIGVRVPVLRTIAKKYAGTEEGERFLSALPHEYYEENMLHGIMISQIKDFETCIAELERFLPYVDNWAVCDCTCPNVLKKNKTKLLIKIEEWINSPAVYTCRFGIKMLMTHFLDKDFKEEYLLVPAKIISEEYYVNMMIAWFYATALAKQYDATISMIESKTLPKWVHNKTIRKALESYRITEEQKLYLRTLTVPSSRGSKTKNCFTKQSVFYIL